MEVPCSMVLGSSCLLSYLAHFYFMGIFLFRTKTEPPIYYLPKKPLEEDATAVEQRKEQVSLPTLSVKYCVNCDILGNRQFFRGSTFHKLQ